MGAEIHRARISASLLCREIDSDAFRGRRLLLQDGAVLELLAIVLVAVGGLAQTALGEPSSGDVIRKGNAAGVHRPGPAVDRSLIENPAATSAGEGQPRAASGRNRFDS